jgi:pyruvate ferredoxin oxidoreductase alpha subunit
VQARGNRNVPYNATIGRRHVFFPVETHIVERLADYIADGDSDAEMVDAESEHSALSICVGAQATGVRTFTATASQGLAYMWEILYIASGMRLPIVMAVANRALSAPINIWNDHSDAIGSRDSGWIQLFVESAQEALDTVYMSYKIGEDKKVLLPVMLNLDGFTLSHVWEPVDIPEQAMVDKFVGRYKPLFCLDPAKPVTMGPIGFPNIYMETKKMQQDAMDNSIAIIKKVNKDFEKQFGRSYGDGMIECYRTSDATSALVCMGTACGTTRVVVDQLRKKGQKVGMIKIKCYRPFPRKELKLVLSKLNAIGVIDRSVSLGQEAPLVGEIKDVMFGSKIPIKSYVAGLGGRDITTKHIEKAFKEIKKPNTVWLY